jgi:hypothetical protein
MLEIVEKIFDQYNIFYAIESIFLNDFLDMRQKKFSFLSIPGIILIFILIMFADYSFERKYFVYHEVFSIGGIFDKSQMILTVICVIVVNYMIFIAFQAKYQILSALSLAESFVAALALLAILSIAFKNVRWNELNLESYVNEFFQKGLGLNLSAASNIARSAIIAAVCVFWLDVLVIVKRRKQVWSKNSLLIFFVATAIGFADLVLSHYVVFYTIGG